MIMLAWTYIISIDINYMWMCVHNFKKGHIALSLIEL